MVMEIPLTKGKVALIDDEDFDRISDRSWSAVCPSGHSWYARAGTTRNKRHVYIAMHRVILNAGPGTYVDHVDGNGLNNTRANLRLCDASQNLMNAARHRNNSSGFKGVYFLRDQPRTKPWCARISAYGRHQHLGVYATAEDAARAYDAKAKELFGEFARLNFPESEV